MLHSGSRGVGNAIGNLFIELAQADMRQHLANLPDKDLAYFEEGSRHFADYVEAVEWAQEHARQNRELMLLAVVGAARKALGKPFEASLEAVNCHHNYVQREQHAWPRSAGHAQRGGVGTEGGTGHHPGLDGAKSFIVRGLGNEESFCSCSHGAGRVMSRTKAKAALPSRTNGGLRRMWSAARTRTSSTRSLMAYKDIDAVMRAQQALVEVVHTLRQVVCVKG